MSHINGDAPRRPVRPALATLGLCALLALASDPAHAGEPQDRISGATGGIVRFPNDLQPENASNLFGEAWGKLAYRITEGERSETSIFALGNLVADSAGFAYNNTAKIGVGISHAIQVNDALNLTFSARHDWFMERGTDVRRSGIRLAADYYYYKRWAAEPETAVAGFPVAAVVFKSYGTLAFPGSLEKGDDNIVLTLGGELSMDLGLSETPMLLSPFLDIDFSWDVDANTYNNKIVPGAGLKIRYPLEHGEIFAGLRLSTDVRWVDGTVDTGAGAFLGWYKGF